MKRKRKRKREGGCERVEITQYKLQSIQQLRNTFSKKKNKSREQKIF